MSHFYRLEFFYVLVSENLWSSALEYIRIIIIDMEIFVSVYAFHMYVFMRVTKLFQRIGYSAVFIQDIQ